MTVPPRVRKTALRPPTEYAEAPRVLPIRRQTVAGMTVDAMREMILRGHFPEGQPLRQDAVAEELGVSRIPVREALRQLEAEGLVTFTPHCGAVVTTLSLPEIEELFELRANIEGDLIRRAVLRMTTDDDARAAKVLKAYELALRSGNPSAWGELNWQFHSTLYQPGNREFTLGIVRKLHQQSERYQRMQLTIAHGETRTREEHRAIAAAARKRDVRMASKLMRDHIMGAGRDIVSVLEKYRETPAPERSG